MDNKLNVLNVTRNLNNITLHRMDHPKVVSDFLKAIYHGSKSGFSDFIIDFSNIQGVFPDVAVPISVLIKEYETRGMSFSFSNLPEYLQKAYFQNPLSVNENQNTLESYCLDKIWKFEDSKDISSLVSSFINQLSLETVFGDGALKALSWSLYEIMDNVLQHSKIHNGYIMAQIHSQSKKAAFCIFDTGQGIFNSLKDTEYGPRSPLDAITLAIKEGITRDKNIGQGNGLWGVHQIIKINSGRLLITSGSACYILNNNNIDCFENLPFLDKNNACTTVDFQISYDKDISLAIALSGHDPEDMRMLNYEDSISGGLIYKLSEKKFGTGTREAGLRIRNDIINIQKASKQIIEIDFSGVAVVSSSFADEFLGKLMVDFGFVNFNRIFHLVKMNEVVAAVINRSVSQRMIQELQKNK